MVIIQSASYFTYLYYSVKISAFKGWSGFIQSLNVNAPDKEEVFLGSP